MAKNIQSGPNANYRDRFDDVAIEFVRTAKPLKRSYRNIVYHRFGPPEQWEEDYRSAASTCEQTAIKHIRHLNAYAQVDK